MSIKAWFALNRRARNFWTTWAWPRSRATAPKDSPAAVSAAGALVTYLRETQRRGLGHIRALRIYSVRDTMMLDATTQRSLELVRNMVDGGRAATLLDILDHTRTPMGGRLLRQWIQQPLQDLERIQARQEAIEGLLSSAPTRDQLREGMRGVRDLERIVARIHCGTANARDLVALATSLREVPAIKSALIRLGAGKLKVLGEILPTLGFARRPARKRAGARPALLRARRVA